jgi:hypothetical protein
VGQPSRRQTGYEQDFAAWAQAQARLLRNRLLQQADLDNIAEELEGLSRSERRELRSCLTLIILHLLKLVHQPERASRSWVNSIHRERRNYERLLQDSPSLKAHETLLFQEAYEDGRYGASKETGLDLSAFPAEPVFSLDQVRDPDFMPIGTRVAGRPKAVGEARDPADQS